MAQAIAISGPGPIVTYQHRGSLLDATQWTEFRFASFGGFATIYNQDSTNDLLVAFPPAVGGVNGITGTGATDSRGVLIPAGGWREFALGGGTSDDCGGVIPSAASCSLWGGSLTTHAFDVVQSIGGNTAGNT